MLTCLIKTIDLVQNADPQLLNYKAPAFLWNNLFVVLGEYLICPSLWSDFGFLGKKKKPIKTDSAFG